MPYKTLDTIVDVYQLHRQQKTRFPFLLESIAENKKIGRYDILFSSPQKVLTLEHFSEGDFLSLFNKKWQASQSDEDTTVPSDLPFRGGWFVFFAYELAQQIEPKLSLSSPPYPSAYAGKCASAIIVDKVEKKTHLVADLSEKATIAQLEEVIQTLGDASSLDQPFDITINEENDEKFLSGVEKSKQYIVNGDVFQVNLSRNWSFDLAEKNVDSLYSHLRKSNPAPFAASCHLANSNGEHFVSILSSSPERLISIKEGKIETRPIAGTRPRGENISNDKALSQELIGHSKERAEHVMLIDLERNDLGRVCQAGSIKVDELMMIESYAHVHHIVSNVIGKLRTNITPAEAIRAVFPGGTITGCPKVRCMEIINELEQNYRGAYTGALGYINHNGDMDTNILIRTFTCHNNKAEFRAGAGIVYDSIGKNELKETRNKAKGLLKALFPSSES